jgi:glycerol kinase
MQLQADLLGVPLLRPSHVESTARGAAFLAGLATGVWRDRGELSEAYHAERLFEPDMDPDTRSRMYAGWLKAVDRARDWADH